MMFNSYHKEHAPVYPSVTPHAHASPPSAPTVNDTTTNNHDITTPSGSLPPGESSSTSVPFTNAVASPSGHGHYHEHGSTLPLLYPSSHHAVLAAPEEYPFPILAPAPGTSSPSQNGAYAGSISYTCPTHPPTSLSSPSHISPTPQSFTSTFNTTEDAIPSPAPAPRIPRPPNAFMLFRSDFLKQGIIPPHIEKRQQNLSQIAGQCWRIMPKATKAEWKALATVEHEKHREKYPNYKFSPAPRGMGRGRGNAAASGSAGGALGIGGSEGKVSQGDNRLKDIREKYTKYSGAAPPPERRRNKVGGSRRARQEGDDDAPYVSRQRQQPSQEQHPLAHPQPAMPPPMTAHRSVPRQVQLYPSQHQQQHVAPSPQGANHPRSQPQSQSNSPTHSQPGSPQYPNPQPTFNFTPPNGMQVLSFPRPTPSIAGNISNPYPRGPRRPSTSLGFIRSMNDLAPRLPQNIWPPPQAIPHQPQQHFGGNTASGAVPPSVSNGSASPTGNFPVANVPRRPSSTGQTLSLLQAQAMSMSMGMPMPMHVAMGHGGLDEFIPDFLDLFKPGRIDGGPELGAPPMQYAAPPLFVHQHQGDGSAGQGGVSIQSTQVLFGDYSFGGAGGNGNGSVGAGSIGMGGAAGSGSVSPVGSAGPVPLDSWATPLSPLEQPSPSHHPPQPQVQPQLMMGTTTPPNAPSPQQHVPLSMPQPQPHPDMPGAYPDMGLGMLGLMGMDGMNLDLSQWGGSFGLLGETGAEHGGEAARNGNFRVPVIDEYGSVLPGATTSVPLIPTFSPSSQGGEDVGREQAER